MVLNKKLIIIIVLLEFGNYEYTYKPIVNDWILSVSVYVEDKQLFRFM